MEVVVEEEERLGLNQEILEIAMRNKQEEEEQGDEWVDHSDIEDD